MKTFATLTAALLASAVALPAAAGEYKKGDMDKMQKTTAMSSGAMSNEKHFDAMDINTDGEVDFTEFSNYLETQYGWDASNSAKEYVRLSDSGIITDRTFAGLSITKMDHTHLDNGMTHKGTMQSADMTSTPVERSAVMSRTTTSGSMNSAMGTPSMTSTYGSYGSFGDYDMNADGRVDFREYSKYRSKAGIRTTQAAQEFIRFSDGQADFDENRFNVASSEDVLSRSYYRAQASNTAVMSAPATTSYTTVPATTSEPYIMSDSEQLTMQKRSDADLDTMKMEDDNQPSSMNYGGQVDLK